MKILSIAKSQEFQKIGKKGEKFFSKTVLLLSHSTLANKDQDQDFCRVGYTVAKTISKLATIRNRAKRRLREAFRKLAPLHAKNHCDYVIIARKGIEESDYEKIFTDLKFCLTRIHKISSKNKNSVSHDSRPKKQ